MSFNSVIVAFPIDCNNSTVMKSRSPALELRCDRVRSSGTGSNAGEHDIAPLARSEDSDCTYVSGMVSLV